MNVIDIIRALVRPIIAIGTVAIIFTTAVKLIGQYGDAEMAKQIVTFLLATGAVVTGFYFGERASKK